jgi:NAD(P)-dependent dehydrogenase (short-subunit alcohol dehydrogenase family)
MTKTPHDRVALITGAGSGIGRAAAHALLADGWRVAFTGRRADALAQAVESAPDAFGDRAARALAVPCDVTDPQAVRALFDAVHAKWGRLDFLFNNAGTGTPPVPFDEIPYESWRRALDTNLTGAFLCSQQAFRLMKAQAPRGGRIVNNGSISAHAPRPLSAPYTSSKHGISGLTKACALDGRAHDIVVGQIDIGNAATEMTERMTGGVLQPDGSLRPEPRMDVRHVGDAIVAMANLPLEANVQFITLMASKMPFIGRG